MTSTFAPYELAVQSAIRRRLGPKGDWNIDNFEFMEAELAGVFPDTQIVVHFRTDDIVSARSFAFPVWESAEDANEPAASAAIWSTVVLSNLEESLERGRHSRPPA